MFEVEEKLIKEIIDKYTAKRDKEEKGTDLFFEYWRIADGLKELINLRKDYGEVVTRELESQKASVKARNKAADIVKECNERLARANGILEGVKAMLQAQDAATHRQRDYYNRAIVQMIDNVKTSIKPIDERCFEPDDLPF